MPKYQQCNGGRDAALTLQGGLGQGEGVLLLGFFLDTSCAIS